MGADLARARAGKRTRTGMSVKKLREFAGSVKGLGEVIKNSGGKTGMGKDKFSTGKASVNQKPKGRAISAPTYKSEKPNSANFFLP